MKTLVKFLSRVRGPNAQDEPLRVFPRPRGADTKVIVTEYELPQALLALHDVQADSKGILWFSSHKTDVVTAQTRSENGNCDGVHDSAHANDALARMP